MLRILKAQAMKAEDAYTIGTIGVPSAVLMERAALSVAEEAMKKAGSGSRILILAGSGNNGGDGFAAARILFLRGIPVTIVFTGNEAHMTEETRRQSDICRRLQIPSEEDADLSRYDIIIDAMLGTGTRGAPTGRTAEWAALVNETDAFVISVDIPSGVSTDTGDVPGCAVRADVTVTMQCAKPGHILFPGAEYTGVLKIAEIGVTGDGEECADRIYAVNAGDLPSLIPKRPRDGNKGTFGKVLVAAGSKDMAGAAVLCATAALRSGCGMVKVVTHSANRSVILNALPEAMLSIYDTEEEAVEALRTSLPWCDTAVFGPGVGTGPEAAAMARFLIRTSEKPLILDADALNIISADKTILSGHRCPVTVTPHIGEMSRLTGHSVPDLKRDLISEARAFAGEYNVTCVLKDARTVTALPDGTVFLNRTGNCGMATAGSGDVLAGIMASLTSCGTETAAAAAVCLHGAAGDAAAERYGTHYMTAGDLIRELAGILRKAE